MVELWLRPPFLMPGRKVAITFCFRLAERTLGYTISTSAVASYQDCALLLSLAVPRTNDRLWLNADQHLHCNNSCQLLRGLLTWQRAVPRRPRCKVGSNLLQTMTGDRCRRGADKPVDLEVIGEVIPDLPRHMIIGCT
jgi:hypothetical protein